VHRLILPGDRAVPPSALSDDRQATINAGFSMTRHMQL
jgi:hypothetical protein